MLLSVQLTPADSLSQVIAPTVCVWRWPEPREVAESGIEELTHVGAASGP